MADYTVKGYNISWHAERSTIVDADTFVVNSGIKGSAGVPGTHLTVSTIPNQSGGDSLIIFYQTKGSDITEFLRDMNGGQWSLTYIPIPDQ